MPKDPGTINSSSDKPREKGRPGRPPKKDKHKLVGRPPNNNHRPPGTVGRPPKQSKEQAAAASSARGNSGASVGRDSLNGNDSDNNSSTSTSSDTNNKTTKAWTNLPPWLLAEKQTPKYFSVPITPQVIPPATLQAIQEFASTQIRPPRLTQSQKVHQQLIRVQQDRLQQTQKIKTLTKKLATTMASAKFQLEQMRQTRQMEIDEAMQALEDNLKSVYEQKLKEQTQTLEQQIAETFHVEFAEQEKKRKHEEKEEEKPPAKKLKLLPEKEKAPLKSENIQKQLEELPKKLDQLQEAKSEMVWLLKQVIKAEMKRKMAVMKRKKLAAAAAKSS